MKRYLRGFTLIEVMIVVAVIGILAALAVPNYIAYRRTAHAKACRQNMETLRTACLTYQTNHGGVYTESQADLVNGGGGVLRREVKCPIGGEYTIKYDTQSGEFNVTCSLDDETEHNVSNK